MLLRILKWTLIVLVSLWLLLIIFISFFSFNFMRGPIERMTLDKTGRELKIEGDMRLKWAWPVPHVVVDKVTFGNPSWAKTPYLLSVDSAELTFDLRQMLKQVLVIIEARAERPKVFLEIGPDGKKNWLLDKQQSDEKAKAKVGRLLLDQGTLVFDDAAQKTRIEADVSTGGGAGSVGGSAGVQFSAKGRYKGMAMAAKGSGGPVLALADEDTPYPLNLQASIGQTSAQAQGTITSLVHFTAVDLKVALRGASLGELYPIIGIALPDTHRYSTEGHLLHKDAVWRYEQMAGKIGASDVAGTVQVDLGGDRPFLTGEIASKLLDIADLGPLIGTAGEPSAGEKGKRDTGRVLPDSPFNTERWNTLDADMKITAKTIRREKQLPIENMNTRVTMKNRLLILDPLAFSVAGGSVASVIKLDGQKEPIRASANLRAQKIALGKLFPAAKADSTSKADIGNISASAELTGAGNSVARMLGSSNGKLGLVINGGEISNFIIEAVGIDLWEMLKFKAKGDQPVQIRCGVADFGIKNGLMQTNILVLDTTDTNVIGNGSIDLGKEQLNLTLNPQPKDKSLISLRTPIHIRGTFAQPQIAPDKARLTLKGAGALALAVVNPLLAVVPLIETGPGADSDCGRLIQQANRPPEKTPNAGPTARPGKG
jgi:uncharacterized protein involved in outer membrane biogenesis